ncbi:MAG: AHH domain-containing protein [Pedobacter sp.]|nr:AHH domain-containing protein [Pedobacter sp.]
MADAVLGGSTALRKALGAAETLGKEAHHIIPMELLKKESVVQDAVNAGFDFNGKVNGIGLKKYTKAGEAAGDLGVHANHPKYTQQVLNEINEWATAAKASKTYSPQNAKKFLENLSGNIKKLIKENPNTKVNNLKF